MESMDNEHHSTIHSRLDRLDIMMGYLEEIKTSKAMGNSFASTTTSSATGTTTTTTTTTTSEGALGNSSVNSSPKSITDVVTETQKKGSLLDRVNHLENRVMKLSLQVEKENQEDKSLKSNKENKKHKKGLKHLVKSCVNGGDVMTKD
ncbi:rho GTPase-activating protein gacE-like [Dioscorea cayenensis subsp. rotundata]|uniref:Rho GTPase-activating protein gacE-like n=1 Tax=Dioscorea cayennensis subsp. rotundata TaxID=55577 RepID=A0AB40AIV4_DIOCR|nr:rho GTPase-activating protein gacE-like [Dioscorea cayenensis subsp. rotundata]